jgi:hypothetical protein
MFGVTEREGRTARDRHPGGRAGLPARHQADQTGNAADQGSAYSGGAARAIAAVTSPRSRYSATIVVSARSQSRTLAARSAAGTRPRCRDGVCSTASAGKARTTGMPVPARASRRICSCRGDDTWLSTQPPGRRGRN